VEAAAARSASPRSTEHGNVAKSLALAPVDGDAASVHVDAGPVRHEWCAAHNAPRGTTRFRRTTRFRITPKIHRALGDARPAGRMTSALDAKKVGDVVMLHAPYGTFTLADARGVTADTPLAFVAGGIGITPVVAMAAEARRLNATRPIAFFHCASTTVRPLVEEVPATFTVLGSRGMIGNIVPMLTAHSEFDQQLAGVHFFLCAPHGMLKAAIEHLTANGVALERIHYEAFESHTS
jgi:ferredoxin-NADP reductase